MSVLAPARRLWLACGLPAQTIEHLHLSSRPDPVVKSHFKLGTAAETSIGLSALAAAYFHQLRTGDIDAQDVSVDARHAAIEFNSEKYYLVDGQPTANELFDDLAGVYETRDGHVRLHTNFPHHKRGILDILGCDAQRASVAAALKAWSALEFERKAIERGMCATALRSFDELPLYPKDRDLSAVSPVRITKIGDAPRREVSGDKQFIQALQGMRVIDMTRVLAGPVCGRTLAAHGADVLWITSPNLPDLPDLDVDTSRGKRTAQLDLNDAKARDQLRDLLSASDVFLQSYRPGGLASRGFSSERAATLRPGIVCANLSAYPPDSAWAEVRGFDSLVQTMSGFNVAEARAYAAYMRAQGAEADELAALPPYRALPMQALDHAAGYFLAFGIAAALCRTITEGGSWEVHVSLAETMLWIKNLGTLDPAQAFGEELALPTKASLPPHPEIAGLYTTLEECLAGSAADTAQSGPRRTLTAIRHSAVMSRTPVRKGCAPMKPNAQCVGWST
ncbi:unnamed protein product [Peniophora sp. CBMAI 1063]|nr:unnamed protein product [Peniophora sp. CBMAI 1063]